jgi:molybdopterin-containing oxidoreductase family iron-sulfur binding subunit
MSQTGTETRSPYFRSVADLNQTPEFQEFLHREFPQAASEFPEGVSRRRWLKLMGASLALGGMAGCRYNREEIAAFVVRPEGRVPGIPNYFATSFQWAGQVHNLLATSMDGRPIKLDGNPAHPIFLNSEPTSPGQFRDNNAEKFRSAGSTAIAQAAVLSLYDPDRLGDVIDRRSEISEDQRVQPRNADSETPLGADPDWSALLNAAAPALESIRSKRGKGLAIVFEATHSPSLKRALAMAKRSLPEATLVEFSPFDSSGLTEALAAAGTDGMLHYDLSAAKTIVDLDAGLLCAANNSVVNARNFSAGRDPSSSEMNRLYSVESNYSTTGSAADFRLAIRPSMMPAFIAKLEKAIDDGKAVRVKGDTEYSNLEPKDKVLRTVEVIANDLLANKGKSLVALGSHHNTKTHQAVFRINQKLENIGKSVKILAPDANEATFETISMSEFADQARAGKFTDAWILACNPVFSTESNIDVASALKAIKNNVYIADYDDETALECQWILPTTHPLESWGDVRSADGTYAICQPQIKPLLGGKDPIELLGLLSGAYSPDTMRFVMETADALVGPNLSERKWKEILHEGFAPDSAFATATATFTAGEPLADAEIDPAAVDSSNVDVQLIPSEVLYDGRLANNAWLQEVPQSITKLTWDNAAIVAPMTARKLGLEQNVMASVIVNDQPTMIPVFVVPGHAEGAVTIPVGYGRTRAGAVGGNKSNGSNAVSPGVGPSVGHDVNALRDSKTGSIISGAQIKSATVPYDLATTQDHFAMDEFGLEMIAKRAPTFIREGTQEQYLEDENFAQVELHHEAKSLWEEPINLIESEQPDLPQWGMSIDLNKCIGCNACVVACQAENNVPVVGKDQVARGREMHWLRIDRYFKVDYKASKEKGTFKDFEDVSIVSQPLGCMHCETAPCEQVCPVAATVHTEEGINAMAYNRCIGTRYCANNCPYKVRRFNYYNYNTEYGYFYGWQDKREEANRKLQTLVLNPEVTVRGRGVMEKCTYCTQRLQNGKIKAKQTGDGKLHDGEIKTACQEACATQAIQFGNIADKSTRIYKAHHDARSYGMLEELNSKPRTRYLARIRNVPDRLMTDTQAHPPEKESHGEGHGAHDGEHGGEGHDAESHASEDHASDHADE